MNPEKKLKQPYHHGDLRESLINAASVMIQESGVDALSMRKLADTVGVSRTAPYHHFKDKSELLCAIAESGFSRQADIIKALENDGTDHSNDNRSHKVQQFEEFILAYIGFATDHPAHYELMYGGAIWKNDKATASLEQAAFHNFKRWLYHVEKLQEFGLVNPQEASTRIAQVAWATIHGLCRLTNDGIYIDQQDVLDMGRSAARMLLLNPD